MAQSQIERFFAWNNLLQVNRVLEDRLDAALKAACNLSLPEFELLLRLMREPNLRLKMIDIANQMLVSKSGTTRLVEGLANVGLLTRETPPDNRRVVYAILTPAGMNILEKAAPAFSAAFDEHYSRLLSDKEHEGFRRYLRKLLEGNDAWDDARCAAPAIDPSLSALATLEWAVRRRLRTLRNTADGRQDVRTAGVFQHADARPRSPRTSSSHSRAR